MEEDPHPGKACGGEYERTDPPASVRNRTFPAGFLAENGYTVIKEDIVEEDGKYYPMMKAVQGQMKYTKKAEYLYGKGLLEARQSGVKRISGKRGPGDQKSFWKSFPV